MPDTEVSLPKRDGSDLVREEYFFLQNTINDFQTQSLEIKKLSIGLSAGVAFLKGLTNISLELSVGGICFLALGFWVLDWLWKEFQRDHYPRISEIERDLGERYDIAPRILASWKNTSALYLKPRRFEFQSLIWLQVCLPHVLIVGLSLLVLVGLHPEWLHWRGN
jgi:hypothetical protein